jgi:hypothetical protein
MADITDGTAYWFASGYAGSGGWLDQIASFHGTIDRAIHRHFSEGLNYLRCVGVGDWQYRTPDDAKWDIVDNGDIDIRIRVAMDDYTPAANEYLVSHAASGGAGGWGFYVDTAGKLVFELGNGSSNLATSSVATGLTAKAIKWLGVTYDSSAGNANFYTSSTNAADITTWTRLGTANRSTGATTGTTSAHQLYIGGTAALEELTGDVYEMELRDGINGTLVADWDANDISAADIIAGTHTDGQSNVWTNTPGTGAEWGRIIDREHFFYDGTARIYVANNTVFEPSSTDDFSFGVGFRTYDETPAAGERIFGKWNSATGDGPLIYSPTGTGIAGILHDGSASVSRSIAITEGKAHTAICVRDHNGSDDWTLWLDGVTGTPITDTTTGDFANGNDLHFGRNANTGSGYFKGEIWSGFWYDAVAIADGDVGTGTLTFHWSLLNQAVNVSDSVNPASIAAVSAMPAPTVTTAQERTPATIIATVAMPAPTVTFGIAVSPATIGATVAMPAPTILSSNTVTPATILTTTAMGAVSVGGERLLINLSVQAESVIELGVGAESVMELDVRAESIIELAVESG